MQVMTECLNKISVKARMNVKLGHHDTEPVHEIGQLQNNWHFLKQEHLKTRIQDNKSYCIRAVEMLFIVLSAFLTNDIKWAGILPNKL